MNQYNVNFRRLALLLLPTGLRKPTLANLAYIAVEPIRYLHRQLMFVREQTDYRLTHNGQVANLRGILNDIFDPDPEPDPNPQADPDNPVLQKRNPNTRRITITETIDIKDGVTIYVREINDPNPLFPRTMGVIMRINRRGFGTINGYDFFVNIPPVLRSKIDMQRMHSVVKTYKLASKRYLIPNDTI